MITSLLFLAGLIGSTNLIRMDTDSELVPYVNQFREDCNRYVDPVRCHNMLEGVNAIKFVPDIPEASGMCIRDYWLDTMGRFVVINRKDWNILREYQKKTLVYHELTHCLTGRLLHDERRMSIMHYGYPREWEIASTWNREVRNLFKEYYQ